MYKLIVFSDIVIALTGAGALAILHKWHMEAAAWTAWSPDLLWAVYYFLHGRSLQINPKNRFMQFHLKIQRYERPCGIAVELAVFMVMLPIFIIDVLA